ncbi:MAG TPA: peptidoglycan-binding protein, partial [Stellaceae bacterium]|nr:peptidoglycan-binding protein [Stellaceae bacterium]
IGIWPSPSPADGRRQGEGASALAAIGYELPDPLDQVKLSNVIKAFQRHFHPSSCDGVADPETLRRLYQVAAAFDKSRLSR